MTAIPYAHASVAPLAQAAVPVRSPRTSLVLAELARQRRFERRQRRCKRQQRCRAWARWTGWLAAFGRWPSESVRVQRSPALCFTGTTPLVYAV
jgi:hypothetical protein